MGGLSEFMPGGLESAVVADEMAGLVDNGHLKHPGCTHLDVLQGVDQS